MICSRSESQKLFRLVWLSTHSSKSQIIMLAIKLMMTKTQNCLTSESLKVVLACLAERAHIAGDTDSWLGDQFSDI